MGEPQQGGGAFHTCHVKPSEPDTQTRVLQAFASTESVLEMGMCGGPVLNAAGKCVGATEGVVPETGA